MSDAQLLDPRQEDAGTTSPARRRDLHLVVLGLAVLVGLALRLPSYFDTLNSDELSTYFVVTEHGPRRIIDIVQGDQEVTPPLYLLLAGLTQGLGDPQDSLRIVPLLCGILAVPLTWALGVRTLDRRAATVGAAVMAVSPFLIFYATEARAYSLALVLSLGSTLALVQAVGGRGRSWWAVYAACSSAAMYTHYTVLFVLAGQAAWALVAHRGAWRWVIGANAAAAVAWLPWFTSYQADQDSPAASLISVLRPFGWGTFRTDVLHWAFSHPLNVISVRDLPGEVGLGLIAVALVVGAVVGARELAARGRRPDRGLVLVAVLALSTPVLAALYSTVGVSVFLPRNLISSWPGLALALGWVVTRPRARPVWVGASALLLAGFALGAVRMPSQEGQRPDYKGAARFIVESGGRDAVAVEYGFSTPGPLTALDVSAAPGEAIPTRPRILRLERPTRADQLRTGQPGGAGQFAVLPVPSPESVGRQAARLAGGRDVYLVVPLVQGAVPPKAPLGRFRAALGPGYRIAGSRTFDGFFGAWTVAVYVLRRSAS